MQKVKLFKIFFIYSTFFFAKVTKEFFITNYNYILYFFYCNINFFRNKNYKKFLKLNSKLFKLLSYKKKNNDHFIFVETFISHPAYLANQLIIAKYLEKILNIKVKLLNKNNNFLINSLKNSYNINSSISFNKKNFIKRYFKFLNTLSVLIKINDLKEIKKLKSNKVKIGEITYDHYVRFTGDLHINKLNFKFAYFYFESLEYDLLIKNIFKNEKCKGIVLSETQFIPSAIVFQNALEANLNVYARYGGPNNIGIRIYNNSDQIYLWKQKFNEDDFFKIKSNFKEVSESDGIKIINNRINGIKNEQDLNDTQLAFEKKKDFDKKELCKTLNWDEKIPIIGIFDHSYTDGLFICGRSIFETNYLWITSTLKMIQKYKDVNWLIKPHPVKDYETHKAISSTQIEFAKLIPSDCNNVKLFPDNLSYSCLFNTLSSIITGNGTVGIEFATYGIPCILANNAHYSGFGFTHEPKNFDEYKALLKNAHNLKRLNKDQILNARIFVSIELNQSLANISLLPKFITDSKIYFKKNYDNFWNEMSSKLIKFDINQDDFYLELKNQIDKKKSHTMKFKYN